MVELLTQGCVLLAGLASVIFIVVGLADLHGS